MVSIRLSVTWVLDGREVREAFRIRLPEFGEEGTATASGRSSPSNGRVVHLDLR
jgi:hypothetical protein